MFTQDKENSLHVDVGIITIREDEFRAILRRFPASARIVAGRHYNISQIIPQNGKSITVAVIRCIEQGNGEAQDAARDLIEDFDPDWILVVGIAGGVPSTEFSLGDVVVSTRIHDFSVEAVLKDGSHEYQLTGGPIHKIAATLAANMPAIESDLQPWSDESSISIKRPFIPWTDTANYYGSPNWKKRVREGLEANFKENPERPPRVVSGPIASSDRLVKDTDTLRLWLKMARHCYAIEMESAGVYRAARRIPREYPVLAIRGISDVVGFNRQPLCTAYACETAATFTHRLVQSGHLKVTRQNAVPSQPEAVTVIGLASISNDDTFWRKIERIAVIINHHRVAFNNYIELIGNAYGLPSDFESDRVMLDKELFELIPTVEIGLPRCFTKILWRLRRIVSVSWRDPVSLHNGLLESRRYSIPDILDRVARIYDESLECFFEMARELKAGKVDNQTYLQVATHHKLTRDGHCSSCEPLDHAAEITILCHEFHSSFEILDRLLPKEAEESREFNWAAFDLHAHIYGAFPIEGLGTVCGKQFYFRARDLPWSFGVADLTEPNPILVRNPDQGFYYSKHEKICNFDDAERAICEAAQVYFDQHP